MPKYIPSLDGLRAVSILIVFLSHAGLGHIVPGGLGVTVFFFISGFLITTLLCREYEAYGCISFGAFYARRLLRLMPPLLAVLCTTAALAWLGFVQGHTNFYTVISQLFFFFNYAGYLGEVQTYSGLGVLWSLSVEEHFYLLWPVAFLVFVCGRLERLWLIVIALIFFMGWRFVRFFYLGASGDEIYYSSDTRLDSLLFGCLLALIMVRGYIPDYLKSNGALYGAVVFGMVLLLVSLVVRDSVFRAVVRYSVQGFALMPLFYYAVTRSDHWLFKPLNWSIVRLIGVYSYSIYLIHFVFIRSFNALEWPSPLVAICSAVLAFFYARLVFQYLERPFNKIRKRLIGHAPTV